MNNYAEPSRSPFQWNRGAWFGSILGGTFWMLIVSGFLLAKSDFVLALVPLLAFGLTAIIACVLWIRRDRIKPYTALQGLLAFLAILLPSTWFSIERWASPEALAALHWPTSQWWLVSFIPAGMLWFWILSHMRK